MEVPIPRMKKKKKAIRRQSEAPPPLRLEVMTHSEKQDKPSTSEPITTESLTVSPQESGRRENAIAPIAEAESVV